MFSKGYDSGFFFFLSLKSLSIAIQFSKVY